VEGGGGGGPVEDEIGCIEKIAQQREIEGAAPRVCPMAAGGEADSSIRGPSEKNFTANRGDQQGHGKLARAARPAVEKKQRRAGSTN